MARMIFVNLPVSDVPKATAFYEAVGAERNPQFSDASTSCMVISDTIYAMLMDHQKFNSFTPKRIVDAREASEVLLCLTADDRSDVDSIVKRAISAGGRADPTPVQDHGFMYGRSYEDLDGHIWEVVWMDVAAATETMAPADASA